MVTAPTAVHGTEPAVACSAAWVEVPNGQRSLGAASASAVASRQRGFLPPSIDSGRQGDNAGGQSVCGITARQPGCASGTSLMRVVGQVTRLGGA